MANDHSTLLRNLRRQGFTIEKGKRHLKVRHREGGKFVVIPSSPSDNRRGLLNCLTDLKRIGYEPR